MNIKRCYKQVDSVTGEEGKVFAGSIRSRAETLTRLHNHKHGTNFKLVPFYNYKKLRDDQLRVLFYDRDNKEAGIELIIRGAL